MRAAGGLRADFFHPQLNNMLSDRQLTAIAKIDSMKGAIKMMNEGKDISNIAMKLLKQDLSQLELQIRNINLDTEPPEK